MTAIDTGGPREPAGDRVGGRGVSANAATSPRGILARTDAAGSVIAGASYRIGDPADYDRALAFVMDGAPEPGERLRDYRQGETVRIGETAPPFAGVDSGS